MYYLGRFICFLASRCLFPIKVFGRERIPKKGAFILASNHVSYLDPIVLGIACPRKISFMARHDLFSGRLLSWVLLSIGVFPVKRDYADLSALKIALRRLKNSAGLALFPEGTRGSAGINNEPQPGIGFLAAKASVPVIPAFVKGTDLALPKGGRFIRRARVTVHFGRQILIERRMPYQDIAQLIMANIRSLSC